MTHNVCFPACSVYAQILPFTGRRTSRSPLFCVLRSISMFLPRRRRIPFVSGQSQLMLILLSGFLVILYSRDLLQLRWTTSSSPQTQVEEGIDFCRDSTRDPKIFRHALTPTKKTDLTDLLEGPGLDNIEKNSYAACKFLHDEHSGKFPHAMQQLYRCVSYWRSDPEKEPWLVMQKPERHAYIAGFLSAVQDVMGVKVVRYRHTLQVARPMVDYGYDKSIPYLGYAMHKPDDMDELRDGLRKRYDLQTTKTAGCKLERGPHDDKKVVPRIRRRRKPNVTILNRKVQNGRRMLNAKAVKHEIQQRFNISSVTVVEFESASFLKQVQVMGETDILISPHGAQLTSIPFLPTCGRVTEIFSLGYYIPEFFGSLASSSGKAYSSIYAGGNEMEREINVWMKNENTRAKAQQLPVCPFLEPVMKHVEKEIADWKSCCKPHY